MAVNTIRSGFVPNQGDRPRRVQDRIDRDRDDEKNRQQRLVGDAITGVLAVVAPPVGALMGGVMELQRRGLLPADARPTRRLPGDDTDESGRALLHRPATPAGAASTPPPLTGDPADLAGRNTRRTVPGAALVPTRKRRLLGV